jgi:hypothetical protein
LIDRKIQQSNDASKEAVVISETSNNLWQRIAAWCGPVYAAVFIIFWGVLAHNLPPPSATFGPQELMDNYYKPYHDQILLGNVVSCIFGMGYCIWSAQLGIMMWKREKYPILAWTQIIGGVLTGWVLTEVPAMWATCAYMTGTVSSEHVWALHTEAWLIWTQTVWITWIQVFAAGVFAFLQHGEPRLFPKWCGWVGMASALTITPWFLIPYHKTGPFAIGGLIVFWAAYGAWILFFVSFSVPMLRGVEKQAEYAARRV